MNILSTIGKTPLVELTNINRSLKARLYAKLESRNPTFSVKDRAAFAMIKQAIEKSKLKAGMEIIEPTSGNTGIALAFIGKALGYSVNVVMPESVSKERISLIKILGANIIFTSAKEGMLGSIKKAEEIAQGEPDKYFMPNQFKNQMNPKIHETTTGPEIYKNLPQIDIFVSAVGTGGTISGVGRFLKKVKNNVMCIAVEPQNSPAITSFLNKKPLTSKPHAIQGIGTGTIPDTLDLDIINSVITVEDEEAFEFAKLLSRKEGILCGISTGANFAAAYRLAVNDDFAGKNIVFAVCDSSERYISTNLFLGV